MESSPIITQLDLDLATIRKDEAYARRAALDAEERLVRERRIERSERRTFIGHVLFGMAAVAILLAIIGALWHGAVSDDDDILKKEQEKTEQVRACLDLPDAAERQLCVLLLDPDREVSRG